ncbi:hypothetical protein ISCGN_029449 [Ixodes scapularis]
MKRKPTNPVGEAQAEVETAAQPEVEEEAQAKVEAEVVESEVEPVVQPVVEPVVQPEAQPEVEPEAQPEVEEEAQAKVEAEVVESEVESVVQPVVEAEVQPEAQPEVEEEAQAKVEAEVVESEVESVVQPVVEAEVQPEAQPEVEPEAQPEVEPEARPEVEAEAVVAALYRPPSPWSPQRLKLPLPYGASVEGVQVVGTTMSPPKVAKSVLLCTIGIGAVLAIMMPPDGVCDFVFYTHVMCPNCSVNKRFTSTGDDTAYKVLLVKAKSYLLTTFGISLDQAVHWIPVYVPDEEVKRIFEGYGRVKAIARERWRRPWYENIETTTRTITLVLKKCTTVDAFPHQVHVLANAVLVFIPGQPQMCLRCKTLGDMRKQCRAAWCNLCRTFGHDKDNWVQTCAEKTKALTRISRT